MTEQNRRTGGVKWLRENRTPRRVLVPLDGSARSERVLRWVAALGRTAGWSVTLLSVLKVDPVSGADPTAESDRVDTSLLAAKEEALVVARHTQEVAETYLKSMARLLKGAVPEVDYHVTTGNPAEQILQVAHGQGLDMVAMATRRESSMMRGILGSVTDRVIRSNEVPCLALRVDDQLAADPAGWPRNVVVPLDGSPMAEQAVRPALTIAEVTGAAIFFLRATASLDTTISWDTIGHRGWTSLIGQMEWRIEASDYLGGFVEAARERGVTAYAETAPGRAADLVLDTMQQLPASMAVMTTHGRSGFERWAVGSVTDKVVRSSGSPVLVIPVDQP